MRPLLLIAVFFGLLFCALLIKNILREQKQEAKSSSSKEFSKLENTLELVKKLIAQQFPQWAHLPIKPIKSFGTDNIIYRLGIDMAVRLPQSASSALNIDKEFSWLPQLAPHLPLAIPLPLGKGIPSKDFPWSWLVYRWLDGEDAIAKPPLDINQAATDLGEFVAALQRIPTSSGPLAGRGRPLEVCDQKTRAALEELHGIIDTKTATAVWEAALKAPKYEGQPVWVHADLHAGNILTTQNRISAIIDFGMAGTGDPACDMMVAWTLLSAETRSLFRAAVKIDDATWARGRGWALTFGLVALPYYQATNPVLAGIARRTINEVLADALDEHTAKKTL